jgi:hypothetical protein
VRHPVLAFIVIWNLLFLGVNLWTGAGLGWVAFSTFGAVVAAGVWTLESGRDRRPS